MKKYLVVGLLILIALAILYVTFIIAAIKIVLGSILLGIAVIAAIAVWITWKIEN